MEVFKSIEPLQQALQKFKCNNKRIGFVPTMGALHKGHISLIEKSRAENEVTVCSIYVNPIQFNNSEDFKKYPKTIEKDIEILEKAGCDILFLPEDKVMYPEPPKVKFEFGALGNIMEGKFREGHFNGVAIVVSKLFNIVKPDNAYFGQKDLQQYLIVRQFAKDLSFNTNVHAVPIFREEDGLAMSSRNVRLSAGQRELAPKIFLALLLAKTLLLTKTVKETQEEIQHFFTPYPEFKLEYLEVVNKETLEIVSSVKDNKNLAVCIAIYLGDVRLIDNLFLFS
ncbi:MAG: Pantothenate synthetase [Chitinophagaceae bacterium]|nr:Pantothenate synthetase [Chitinophagaceae bacterium]